MSQSMLAAKFRPKKFSEVHGQPHVIGPLLTAIKSKNLSQALLLHGPAGTGKTTLARIIAKSVNCSNQIDGEPCSECGNCKRIDSETSQDLIEFDAATHGGIDEIREIQAQVQTASLASHFRVFLIDEAHALSNNASNALLKTLEEPPRNVIFILATTELNKIIPTIRSRCQRYSLAALNINEVRGCLTKISNSIGVEFEPQALDLISRAARGGMRDAIQFLEKVVNGKEEKKVSLKDVVDTFGIVSFSLVFSFMMHIANGKFGSIITYIDTMIKEGIHPSAFWAELQELFRVATFAKQIPDIAQLQKLAQYDDTSLSQIIQAVKQIGNSALLDGWKIAIDTQNSLELSHIASRSREVIEEASLRIASLAWKTGPTQIAEAPKKKEQSFTNGLPAFAGRFETI